MKDSTEKSVILIVDDDAESREVLSELLAREGYTVVCAENGRDALDYLSRSIPSLIILDLMMPVMSGRGIPRAAARRSQIEFSTRGGHECQWACGGDRRGRTNS